MEHYDKVEKAYSELKADGSIVDVAPGPFQNQTIEEQKAYLTRRAAYYLWQVDAAYGLLSKTTGNNVQGLSVDITLKTNGEYYDIATDVELAMGYRAVRPVDSGGSTDTSLIPRWVLPTRELAGLDDEEPPNEEPPSEILDKLDQILVNQANMNDKMDHMIQLMVKMHSDTMLQLATIPKTHPAPPVYQSGGLFKVTLYPLPEKK